MKLKIPFSHDGSDDLDGVAEEVEQASEDDLWLSRLVPDFN